MEKDIRKAYIFLREHNNTIPSEILDFMLNASLEKLKKIEFDIKLKDISSKLDNELNQSYKNE